jgi:hypothetical protein
VPHLAKAGYSPPWATWACRPGWVYHASETGVDGCRYGCRYGCTKEQTYQRMGVRAVVLSELDSWVGVRVGVACVLVGVLAGVSALVAHISALISARYVRVSQCLCHSRAAASGRGGHEWRRV